MKSTKLKEVPMLNFFPHVRINQESRYKKFLTLSLGVTPKRRISCVEIRSDCEDRRPIHDQRLRGSLQLVSSTPTTPQHVSRRFTTYGNRLKPFHLRKTSYTVMILGAPMVGKTFDRPPVLVRQVPYQLHPTLERYVRGGV